LQARSLEESPEAIKERVSQLEPELRKQVQARSYGTRRNLIEAPLRELELDITPRLGWVRDPRLLEPEPLSEKIADDIVAAFESSKRRLLIVGEPGSGKTIAAYSLIEYLDEAEGDERTPLLVNLSSWEAQEDFEAFLVDYLCASVGYEVHERAVASAFITSGRYNLILDGLDEIPLSLRQQFSERLDKFIGGLPSEVGVVVTCRTQEYEQLLAAHSTGLGLVQAVEILPLITEQLDSALTELVKFDEDWEAFLSQRDLTAGQRTRGFLNLAVAGRLRPRQLLEYDGEQEVRDLILESYLDRTLADQREYEPRAARTYLTWIARFLNGDAVSPFSLKTTDYTVFDLADLTPPDPPRRYRLFGALLFGLLFGPFFVYGLDFARTGRAFFGSVFGLVETLGCGLVSGLNFGLPLALGLAWGLAPVFGLLVTRSVLITSRTPKEARARSLIAAQTWLLSGLVSGLVGAWVANFLALSLSYYSLSYVLTLELMLGLGLGLILALRNGGWFVLLQELAHRRLARAGNLPPRLYDFLEWGVDRQIFRRVGGGVRFRHNLIQQHLANTSEGVS